MQASTNTGLARESSTMRLSIPKTTKINKLSLKPPNNVAITTSEVGPSLRAQQLITNSLMPREPNQHTSRLILDTKGEKFLLKAQQLIMYHLNRMSLSLLRKGPVSVTRKTTQNLKGKVTIRQ